MRKRMRGVRIETLACLTTRGAAGDMKKIGNATHSALPIRAFEAGRHDLCQPNQFKCTPLIVAPLTSLDDSERMPALGNPGYPPTMKKRNFKSSTPMISRRYPSTAHNYFFDCYALVAYFFRLCTHARLQLTYPRQYCHLSFARRMSESCSRLIKFMKRSDHDIIQHEIRSASTESCPLTLLSICGTTSRNSP